MWCAKNSFSQKARILCCCKWFMTHMFYTNKQHLKIPRKTKCLKITQKVSFSFLKGFQTVCLMPKFDTCQFSCHNCKQVLTADEFSLLLIINSGDADTSRKTAKPFNFEVKITSCIDIIIIWTPSIAFEKVSLKSSLGLS